jgi:hypothetical protein
MNPIEFVVVMVGCITAATIIAFRRESARLDEHVAAFLTDHDFHRLSASTRSAENGARVESPLGAGSTPNQLPAYALQPASAVRMASPNRGDSSQFEPASTPGVHK